MDHCVELRDTVVPGDNTIHRCGSPPVSRSEQRDPECTNHTVGDAGTGANPTAGSAGTGAAPTAGSGGGSTRADAASGGGGTRADAASGLSARAQELHSLYDSLQLRP